MRETNALQQLLEAGGRLQAVEARIGVQMNKSAQRPLFQASNGDLYETAPTGGGNGGCAYDCGTLFKITAAGNITYLHDFCSLSGCGDGGAPERALVQASNGTFHGTTSVGGAGGVGTVFEITPAGKLTTLLRSDAGRR